MAKVTVPDVAAGDPNHFGRRAVRLLKLDEIRVLGDNHRIGCSGPGEKETVDFTLKTEILDMVSVILPEFLRPASCHRW